MKLQDLETGDVIVTKNGKKYLVLRSDNDMWATSTNHYLYLDTYSHDMTYDASHAWDIMQVYRGGICDIKSIFKVEHLKPIFDRTPTEMTLAEIEDVLGYKVKVVDKHD